MIWAIIVVAVVVIAGALALIDRRDRRYRRWRGRSRVPAKGPGDDYLPPPSFGG